MYADQEIRADMWSMKDTNSYWGIKEYLIDIVDRVDAVVAV